jgi:hypothetical protein
MIISSFDPFNEMICQQEGRGGESMMKIFSKIVGLNP